MGGMRALRTPQAQSSQVPHLGSHPRGCDPRGMSGLQNFSLDHVFASLPTSVDSPCSCSPGLLTCLVSLAQGVWGLSWGK